MHLLVISCLSVTYITKKNIIIYAREISPGLEETQHLQNLKEKRIPEDLAQRYVLNMPTSYGIINICWPERERFVQ